MEIEIVLGIRPGVLYFMFYYVVCLRVLCVIRCGSLEGAPLWELGMFLLASRAVCSSAVRVILGLINIYINKNNKVLTYLIPNTYLRILGIIILL